MVSPRFSISYRRICGLQQHPHNSCVHGVIAGMRTLPCCTQNTPTPMLKPCIGMQWEHALMGKAVHLLCRVQYCAEAACTHSTRHLACAETTLLSTLTRRSMAAQLCASESRTVHPRPQLYATEAQLDQHTCNPEA